MNDTNKEASARAMQAMLFGTGALSVPVVIVTARDLTAEDRSRLNGRVERIIQKTALDDMLREMCQVLAKCIERRHRQEPAEA